MIELSFIIFKKTDDVDEHALFDYGPPAGDPLVRRQLAEFLKNQYNDDVDRLGALYKSKI